MNKLFSGFRLIILCIGLFISCPIWAANSFQSIDTSTTIVEVRTYLDHAALRISPSFTETVGCPGTVNGQWIVIDWSTDTNNKAMYNAALGAFLLGKQVTFGIKNDCNLEFGDGTATTYRIDMLAN